MGNDGGRVIPARSFVDRFEEGEPGGGALGGFANEQECDHERQGT